MKATRFLAMAAAALTLAACSSDELASVEQQPAARGMKPVEFATAVNHQTRSQITELTTYWVETTGTFYKADGTAVNNPTLTVGNDGSYTVNDDAEASVLYWPIEGTDATFSAWYYEGGAEKGALDNRTAALDAVGAYATHAKASDATSVGLDFKHAVSKAVFKAKMHEAATGTQKVKIDIKGVALRSMKYAATAYTAPSADPTMGAFTVGTDKRDLIGPASIDLTADAAWITESAPAATDLQMPMFVMPQAIAAEDIQDLSATGDWTGAYISVLAQIRLDDTDDVVIFPRGTGTDKYAWIALPLPSDFAGFTAHKKYVFTLNFRNDALGVVDKDQNPNNGDDPNVPDTSDEIDNETPGDNITLPNHSGFALSVTVETVEDFDGTGNEFDVNDVNP